MILTGIEILRQVECGNIVVNPFCKDNINPNSYNLSLGSELVIYENDILDLKIDNPTKMILIPKDGYILQPGELYLAKTSEYTETHNLVPRIVGRSSIARLGLSIHQSAGFGDVGFCGNWTLGLVAVKPIRIFPGVKICQIYYETIIGDVTPYNSKKYQNMKDIQPSKYSMEK